MSKEPHGSLTEQHVSEQVHANTFGNLEKRGNVSRKVHILKPRTRREAITKKSRTHEQGVQSKGKHWYEKGRKEDPS